jgi:hypothetical protein
MAGINGERRLLKPSRQSHAVMVRFARIGIKTHRAKRAL